MLLSEPGNIRETARWFERWRESHQLKKGHNSALQNRTAQRRNTAHYIAPSLKPAEQNEKIKMRYEYEKQ